MTTILLGAVIGVLLTLIAEPLLGRPIERSLVRVFGFLGEGIGQRDLDLTGIWHSIYTYTTSDGGGEFRGHHYVVVRQFRNSVTVRSLDHPEGSKLWMELEVDSGLVLTGRWREVTSKKLEFYGAIQMLVKPSRQETEGLWIGYGRSRIVNVNKWEMVRMTNSKQRRERKRYTKRAQRDFALSRSPEIGSRILGYPDNGI